MLPDITKLLKVRNVLLNRNDTLCHCLSYSVMSLWQSTSGSCDSAGSFTGMMEARDTHLENWVWLQGNVPSTSA